MECAGLPGALSGPVLQAWFKERDPVCRHVGPGPLLSPGPCSVSSLSWKPSGVLWACLCPVAVRQAQVLVLCRLLAPMTVENAQGAAD